MRLLNTIDQFVISVTLSLSAYCAIAMPSMLESMDDLDLAVGNAFVSLTNSTSILPSGNGSYEIAQGYYLFATGSEIESSTNLFRYSSRMGISAWTVRVLETQGVERVWHYEGDGGAVFRTNSVSVGFDAGQWVDELYGDPPGWLSFVEEDAWYDRRDRSRFAVTISLVASNNWALFAEAWDDALTNSPPADTNSVAFIDINTSDNFVTLELYSPANPMPIEIYSSADLPTNGVWSFAGVLNATGPFDCWQDPAGDRQFFNAARGDVDTDHDGIPDGRENLVHGTNPGLADSDDDGLSDRAELYQSETDPNNPDCDDDAIPDGWEVTGGMNPFDATDITGDPDNDHLYNLHEYWIDSDPQVADTNMNYAIADAMKAVDLSISGLVASASINIFSTQNHSATNYVRNTNCWAAAYDLTCCSPWNSYSDGFGDGDNRAGTLISPRHVLFAAHYDHVTTNDVLRFVDKNNNVIERKLIAKNQHPDYPPGYPGFYPDLTIGLLDSDVPTNQISFAKVLPDDYRDYIGSGRFLPALCLDQEEKALIADLVDVSQTNLVEGSDQVLTVFDYPADTNRLNYSEEIILGDSGNPAFLILDGQLVLLAVWTFGDAGAGTSITTFKNDINQLMTDLGGGYQLTEIDLSAFSSLVN